MSDFDAWIGRETRAQDILSESLAIRWLSTFDMSMAQSGALPQGIHFALCTPEVHTNRLGEDGHPERDRSAHSFMPPLPLPRRMWASSAIEFFDPITIGSFIERFSRIASISEKEGSSGKLAFVNVEHETMANQNLALRETQTLVYREAAAPDAPLSPPDIGEGAFDFKQWDAMSTLTPDPRLLFRYSALTFNSHRIHYDAPYARDVERYRGLVVHGPLTASLMLQLAARELGENILRQFEFRGVSPAIAGETLHIALRKSAEGYELGAFAADGRQVMKASAAT